VNEHFRLHRIKCIGVCLRLCLRSPGLNTWDTRLEKGLREISGLKSERVSGGWTKLHSEQLHDLYWWVNVGGKWTERLWDRWGKGYELEKLKIDTNFQLKTLRGTDTLGVLGLVEMLKDVMNLTRKIKIPVPFRKVKYKFFLRYRRSAKGTNMSVSVSLL